MLPVSRDTLLRVVRRRAPPPNAEPVRVIGIDDFAWKRGQRYGTLLCDLERRRIIDLLADREAYTIEAWLADHPEIIVVSRDRGGAYGQAATNAAPQAVQVADRWHLMENASAAFVEALRRSMWAIRQALGSTTLNPALLTCAERLQYDGFLRRQESNQTIKDLASKGASIKAITRLTGRSRKLVRSVLRGADEDVFRCRASVLEPYLGRLGAEWVAGCRNGAELWRRLRTVGFKGSLRVVTEWATQRAAQRDGWMGTGSQDTVCAATKPVDDAPTRASDRRRRHHGRRHRGRCAGAHDGTRSVGPFPPDVSSRDTAALLPWIADTEDSLLDAFGKGISADLAAVKAALSEPGRTARPKGRSPS